MRYEFSVMINSEDAIHVSGVVVDVTEEQMKTYERQKRVDKLTAKNGIVYKFPTEDENFHRLGLYVFRDDGRYTGLPHRTIVSAHASDARLSEVMLAEFMEHTGAEEITLNTSHDAIAVYASRQQAEIKKMLSDVLGVEI